MELGNIKLVEVQNDPTPLKTDKTSFWWLYLILAFIGIAIAIVVYKYTRQKILRRKCLSL